MISYNNVSNPVLSYNSAFSPLYDGLMLYRYQCIYTWANVIRIKKLVFPKKKLTIFQFSTKSLMPFASGAFSRKISLLLFMLLTPSVNAINHRKSIFRLKFHRLKKNISFFRWKNAIAFFTKYGFTNVYTIDTRCKNWWAVCLVDCRSCNIIKNH